VLTLNYEDQDWFERAWSAVQRRECFQIVIAKGIRTTLIKRMDRLRVLLIANPQQRTLSKRFGILWLYLTSGFLTPSLWAIWSSAIGYGMSVSWNEDNAFLRIVFQTDTK